MCESTADTWKANSQLAIILSVCISLLVLNVGLYRIPLHRIWGTHFPLTNNSGMIIQGLGPCREAVLIAWHSTGPTVHAVECSIFPWVTWTSSHNLHQREQMMILGSVSGAQAWWGTEQRLSPPSTYWGNPHSTDLCEPLWGWVPFKMTWSATKRLEGNCTSSALTHCDNMSWDRIKCPIY